MTDSNQWDTMPWVEEQMTTLGIPPPQEPEYECPVIMPGTLSTLASSEYTKTYEMVLGWFGYLTEKTAYAKAMILQCENEMTFIETNITQHLTATEPTQAGRGKEKKLSAKAIELRVKNDPRYSELMLISQKWRQLHELLRARLETVDANLKTVSRQIEIRKIELGSSRTQSNMPYRGNRP